MNQDELASRARPRLLSLLRIIIGFLLMAHGTQKLFNFPPSTHPMAHLPPLLLTAGVLETIGGPLILLGIFTRPVALVLAGEMAVAYFRQHAPRGFWPILNMGELAVIFCFVFLYLAAAGGGVWSVERLWERTRQHSDHSIPERL
jgi:putative oxidoreductase